MFLERKHLNQTFSSGLFRPKCKVNGYYSSHSMSCPEIKIGVTDALVEAKTDSYFLTGLQWSLNEKASAEHLLLLSGLLFSGKVCLSASAASSTWYLLPTQEAERLCFSAAGSHFLLQWNHRSHKRFPVTWRDNDPVNRLDCKGMMFRGLLLQFGKETVQFCMKCKYEFGNIDWILAQLIWN